MRELIAGAGMRSTAQGEVLTTNPLRPDLLHELTEAMAELDRPGQRQGLGFPDALAAAFDGRLITRERWAAGTFVIAQAGLSVKVDASTAAATGMREGADASIRPQLVKIQGLNIELHDPGERMIRHGVRPQLVAWGPNQGDLSARDWQVLARPDGQA